MAKLNLLTARTDLRTYVKPPGASDAVVDGRLGQVAERFINGGKWKGALVEADIAVYDGQITLPRSMETILAVRYNERPVTVRPMWYQFLQGGHGKIEAGKAGSGPIELTGDYPTFRDVTGNVYLRAESPATEDTTDELWVEGLDADGEEIYSTVSGTVTRGFSVGVNDGTVTGQVVSYIRSITKTVTKRPVTLIARDTTTNEEVTIGIYDPSELTPAYRRYLVSEQEQDAPVRVLAKRAYVKPVADKDVLVPGNLGAYKLGLLALNYEDANDDKLADAYWARAFDLLNKEAKEFYGSNAGSIQFVGFGYGAHGIAQLN